MYYSIKEVAGMFNVNESLLRFWEKEFPQIRPEKNNHGTRKYTKDDLETIGLIHHLVKEKGMTLEGARKRLKENKDGAARNYEVIKKLEEIREELLTIKKELDHLPDSSRR